MKNAHPQRAEPLEIAKDIAAQFATLELVESVVLGGSLATGKANEHSDIDLYVYYSQAIPLETRAAIIEPRASQLELDAPFWETEDYWLEKDSGIKVETIYRDDWILKTLQDMFENNRAHMGASTSLWHNVVTSKVLFDRNGWFASLKRMADVPYPDNLADAIIRKNFALLQGSLAAHPKQLTSAIARNDVAYVINLIYMILNSYFDILFALNRSLHPGSKRQLEYAEALDCTPEGMSEDVRSLLTNDLTQIVTTVERLIDHLEILLKKQGAL